MTKKILTPQVLDEDSNGFRDYIWKYGYANWFILDNNDNVIRRDGGQVPCPKEVKEKLVS